MNREFWLPLKQVVLAVLVSGALLLAGASVAGAQGLTTTDTAKDWEEVNFEFDSAILSDGYPSLLRLAELLKQNPSYRLELVGHTDSMGTVQYNNSLSQRRANTVKEFLVKYGANASQITTTGQSKNTPKVPNTSKEGRFINRRVVMNLRDGQGNVVAAGGVGDSISALQELMRKQEECCSEILRRLDKLDDILAAINGLKNENDKLRGELDQVKNSQNEMARRLGSESGAGAGVGAGSGSGPVAQDIARATKELLDQDRDRDRASYPGYDSNKFTLMGLNFGPRTPDGNLTFTGRARYFNPFSKNFAIQSEGEFMYWKDRQEGQFDLGLVGRGGPMQLGLFSSFRHVNFREFAAGATLGQASATVDYVFNRGRIGAYGTKAFLTDQLVNTAYSAPTGVFRVNTYAAVVDQLGFSGQVGVWGDAYIEGNAGALFRQFGDNKFGGMGRLVQPVSKRVAVSVEAGLNETLVANSNYGRLAVGLLFGNWLKPKDYANADGPVPVDIPRVRYELVQRTERIGNTAPVADAGGDRLGVEAGEFILDGSGSYDPDGDTISFQWDQISGPTVSLGGRNTSRATFTAAQDQTYVFRLTVRDTEGATGIARATISTQRLGSGVPGGVRIARFEASPMNLGPGESTTLSWIAEGADSVTITNVGTVEAAGSRSVTPTQNTTYTLTATRGEVSVQSTVTVTVGSTAAPRILRFSAGNPQIAPGGQSALIWEVDNATEVSITSIGVVERTGTSTVSPETTTTYVLTARNAFGQSTAQTVVSVTAPVKIVDFRANPPASADPNTPITLTWQTEGAQEVVITGIGPVANSGSIQVSPAATTSYTLIAYGAVNNASAVVVVQVGGFSGTVPGVLRINRFEASPVSISAGQSSTLNWQVEGADSVAITGVGSVDLMGSQQVTPTQTTTYTLTAARGSTTVQSSVTVSVGSAAAPRIVRFTASNPQVLPGAQSTLLWEVENATEVTISGIGTVQPNGSSAVTPLSTTTYVLTARNASGESTAQTIITVASAVRILDFRASPAVVTAPNSPVTLTWQTEGATEVIITGVGPVDPNGSVQVNPSNGASYTLIAYGPASSVSAIVVIQGTGTGGGGAGGNRPPVANAGADRNVTQGTFTLDGTGSFDPDGDPVTYRWRQVSGNRSNIVNPESPTPTIVANVGGPGIYVYELTVTDSFGAFSVDTVRIIFGN